MTIPLRPKLAPSALPKLAPSALSVLLASAFGLLLGAFSAAPLPAAAQATGPATTTGAGDHPQPTPIVRVVTATRIPQYIDNVPAAVEVVEREQLEQFGDADLVQALQHTTGLPFLLQGPTERFAGMYLRGAPISQVLLLVDGLPVDPAQGYSQLAEIPIAAVERVEIVRGPASAVWGSQAAGGVINVITRRPGTTPESQLQSRAGSRGHEFRLLHAHGQEGGSGFVLAAQNLKDHGVRPNSGLESSRFTGRFQHPLDPHKSLDITISYGTSERGSPGPLGSSTPRARYSDRQFRWSVGVLGGAARDPHASPSPEGYRWQVYGLHYRQHHQDPDINPIFGLPESTHRNQALGLEWGQDFVLRNGLAHIGASLRHDQVKSTAMKGPAHERWTGSVSLEAATGLSPRLNLTSGIRMDAASRQTVEFSPRLGLLYEAAPRHRYRAQVGRVFRLPNFNDLYWNEPGLKGNPDLKPEHGWSFEVGGDHRFGAAWDVSWTVFQRFMDGLLGWRPVDESDRSGPWEPYNAERTRTFGVELLGRYSPGGPWEATWTYTYLDARHAGTGEPIDLVAPHEATAAISWKGQSARVSVGARHRGKRPDFGQELPAYTVAVAAARVDLGPRWWLQVEADNLFDARYEDRHGFPMPGRTLWVRLGYGF